MLKLLTTRLLSKWISLTSSSFKHHASFIIQIDQLAFLEQTNSVARKHFNFGYSFLICLPFVECVKYKMFWCNRELLKRADCKAKLRKANYEDNVRLRKLKGASIKLITMLTDVNKLSLLHNSVLKY